MPIDDNHVLHLLRHFHCVGPHLHIDCILILSDQQPISQSSTFLLPLSQKVFVESQRMGLFSFLTTLIYLLFIFLLLVTVFLWLVGKHRESRLTTNNIDPQLNQSYNQSIRRSSGFSTIDPTPTIAPRRLSFSGGIQTPISAPPLPSQRNLFETITPTHRRSPRRRVTFSLTPEQQRNEYYKIAMQRRVQARAPPVILSTPPNKHIPIEKLFPNDSIHKPCNLDLTASTHISMRERTPKASSIRTTAKSKEIPVEKQEEPSVEKIVDNDDTNTKLDRTPWQRLSNSSFNNNSFNGFARHEDQNHHGNTFPLIHKSMAKRKPIYYEDMITAHSRENHVRNEKYNYSAAKEELQNEGDASNNEDNEPQVDPKRKDSAGLFSFGNPGGNLSERDAFLRGAVKHVSQPSMRSFRFEIQQRNDIKFIPDALR